MLDLFPGHRIILWHPVESVSELAGIEARPFPNVLGVGEGTGRRSFIPRAVASKFRHFNFGLRAADLLVGALLTRLTDRAMGVTPATREAMRTVQEVGLVVTYGSGALNDLWLQTNLLRWSLVYICARIIGRPVALTGQGIGPLRNRLARFLLGRALQNVQLITLREPGKSVELLGDLRVKRPKILITGDDALVQRRLSDEQLNEILNSEGVPTDQAGIAVHIRPTDYESHLADIYPTIARALDKLVEKTGKHVLFVPMSYKSTIDDRDASENIRRQMRRSENAHVLQKEYSAAQVKAIIGSQSLAIGVSYHFGVFALSSGVPTICLYSNEYYQMKSVGLYAGFGPGAQPVDLHAVSASDDIVWNAVQMLEKRSELSQSLVASTDSMLEQSREAGQILRGLVVEPNSVSLVASDAESLD